MDLYFSLRTRSVRARWLLEELGVPYNLIRLDAAKQEAPPLSLSPLGEFPVLVDGATVLTQSLAICLYLGDGLPAPRAELLQWMVFAEVTLEPVVLAPGARTKQVLDIVDAHLDGREFIAGEAFTAADIVMASVLHMAHALKLLDGHPKLFEYVIRQTKRPASRRAVMA